MKYAAAADTTTEINFVVDISGSASFLGGLFSLGYGVQYAAPTLTKALAAGGGGLTGDGVAVAYPTDFGYQAIYNGGTDLLEDIAVKH